MPRASVSACVCAFFECVCVRMKKGAFACLCVCVVDAYFLTGVCVAGCAASLCVFSFPVPLPAGGIRPGAASFTD